MFNDMFGKKKKKNEDDYNEYEDDGNFSYNEDLKTNEFNDATIEYGDGEEIEEEVFDDNPTEINKNKLLFYALIGFLILLLLIVLLIRGCVLTNGTLKEVKLTAPDIIYVGETEKVTVKASGSGNLKNTIYKFDTSNNSIVEVKAKGYVKGKIATNELIPITTGRFILEVSGQLDDVKLPSVEKEIIICRRLSNESFNGDELTAVIDKPIRLNVDLGDDIECFNDLNYSIADESIVTIDNNGNLVGLKKGTTTITFTSDGEKITKTVNVATDSVAVKGLKVNKTKLVLTVGSSEQLQATIDPSNATNKNIKWQTSNSGVVTVSNTGKITGVGRGKAIVKATTEDGDYSVLIDVTVNNKSISTNPSKPSKDTTAPKVTSAKIYSNNQYSGYAKKGDKITLEFVVSEQLGTKPSVKIGGNTTAVTCTGQTCKAVGTVVNTTPEGEVSFLISSYKDKTGNTGAEITKTTDGSKVIVDKIQPRCSITPLTNTATSQSVKFTWSDDNSGVRYVLKPDDTTKSSSVVGTKIDGNQTFSFAVKSYDYVKKMTITDWAGNSINCSHTITGTGSVSQTFTATFKTTTGISNIGTTSLSCTTSGTNKSCTVIAPSITAKIGYTALGWSTSASATSASYKPGASITLYSNITLYAMAKKNSSIGGGSSGGGSNPIVIGGDDDDGGSSCAEYDKCAACGCASYNSTWTYGSYYNSSTGSTSETCNAYGCYKTVCTRGKCYEDDPYSPYCCRDATRYCAAYKSCSSCSCLKYN